MNLSSLSTPFPLSLKNHTSSISLSRMSFKPNLSTMNLSSLSTPFPLSFKNPTLHSPHKVQFRVHNKRREKVHKTRKEMLTKRKTDEFEKFYDTHSSKPNEDFKDLTRTWVEEEMKKLKKGKSGGELLPPIKFGDILSKGKWPTITFVVNHALGITNEKNEEEKKEEEKKQEEKKPKEKKEEEKKEEEKKQEEKKLLEEEAKEDAKLEKFLEEDEAKKEEFEDLILVAMVLDALKKMKMI